MQTFLPFNDYYACAACLDRQRLGKQRVEALQIMKALERGTGGWITHPAVLMWRGHEGSLIDYTLAVCDEWTCRGYVDRVRQQIVAFREKYGRCDKPDWLSDLRVIRGMRSNLIKKLPEHYRPLWPDLPDDLPYFWPVQE